MPFAANLVGGSLIGVIQLSESGDRSSLEEECLILPMERLILNSPSRIDRTNKPKSIRESYGDTYCAAVVPEEKAKKIIGKNVENKNSSGCSKATAQNSGSSSKPLIQQPAQELAQVHHGIAASSMPIPFRTMIQNWKEVPKLHQYSPAQLQVVFHRRSGEVETVTPGNSFVEDETRRLDEIPKKIDEILSPTPNTEVTAPEISSSNDVVMANHSINSETKRNHFDRQHVNPFSDAYFGSFKTQQVQTDYVATSGKSVQTEEDTSNIANHYTNINVGNSKSALTTQETQTSKSILNVAHTASQTEVQIGPKESTFTSATHACSSCQTMQDQVQKCEKNLMEMVKMVDNSRDLLTEQVDQNQKLIQENMEVKPMKDLYESKLAALQKSLDYAKSKLEESLNEGNARSQENFHMSLKIAEFEEDIEELQKLKSRDEISQILQLNDQLQNQNYELEANQQALEFKLGALKGQKERQEAKLSQWEELAQQTKEENSQLKIKMQQLQTQIDSFQHGMSRLRSTIDRPVTGNANSVIPDSKVEEILIRAENLIASYPDSENRVATITNYLSDMKESVAELNGGSQPPDALSNTTNCEQVSGVSPGNFIDTKCTP